MRFPVIFFLVLTACQSSKKESVVESSPAVTEENKPAVAADYDYTPIYGIYDHESTTQNFGGVISIQPQGFDVYATISVAQGNCKAETEAVVKMAEHTETYFIGFYEVENCRLQFTFYPVENKIDIQEIGVCTIHGPTCSFEGRYTKRKQD